MKKLLLISFVFSSSLSVSFAQNISTIAGNGVAGYSGNGGPATAAELDNPNGMGIDAAGNVYSATTPANCITKISASGILTIVAGIAGTAGFYGDGGPATAAELNGPNAVTIDEKGNMYIAERYNNRIRMVNTNGIISTIAGNGTAAWGGDGAAATAAELDDPAGTAIDSKGNIYIAEYGSGVVRKVNTSGIISTIAGQPNMMGYNGDGIAATAAKLNYDISVAIDTLGNLYISDIVNYRVRCINTSGIITTFVGNGIAGYSGDGGPATAAEVSRADYLFIDKKQNLYFGDWYNNCVRKVNTSGIITTIAGNGVAGFSGDGGAATAAELYQPTTAVVTSSGNIYISDDLNNRIRKIIVSTEGIQPLINSTSIMEYPNPSNGTYTFVASSNTILKCNLEVFDLLGQSVVSDNSLTGSQFSINLGSQPNGVYIYRITSENGELIGEGKLVLQK